MIALRMSKSAVNTYLQCPYLFKLSYIDKVEMKKTPYAMNRGIDIHSIFEEFFAVKGTINDAIKALHRSEDGMRFFRAVESAASLATFLSPDGKTMPKLAAAEKKMYSKELNFVGIVDAIFSDGNEYLLLDYKTGKEHPLKNYYFELALYAILAEKELGTIISYWGIYFIDSRRLVYEKINREKIDKANQVLNDVRKKIMGRHFEKKVSQMCKTCKAFINGVCNGKKN